MAEEIDFENGRNSNFEGLVTLTLTFDPAIPHTVVHHSSTSTYTPYFIQIEETFCGRADVRTHGRTDISPLYIIRSTLGSRPNNSRSQRSSVHKFRRKVPHLRCDSHTSFKVKRSKVSRPINAHTHHAPRPTNIKLGVLMEDDDPHQPQAL